MRKLKEIKKIVYEHIISNRFLIITIMFIFVLIIIFSLTKNLTNIPSIGLSNSILLRTNLERSKNGCPVLTYNEELEKAANERAKTINNTLNISHEGWNYIVRKYYIYKAAGENFTLGYETENKALNAMIASDAHRKNILNCKFKDVGIGKSGKVLVVLYGSRNLKVYK